jgi:hypothetical protein
MDMHEWIEASDLASCLSYHYNSKHQQQLQGKDPTYVRPTIHAPSLPVYGNLPVPRLHKLPALLVLDQNNCPFSVSRIGM